MTLYTSKCQICEQLVEWQGLWVHRQHTDHDPQVGWRPMERLNAQGEWEAV